MLALGLALNTLGIGLFCWLILALAVYALPFFVALSVGISAFSRWRGPLRRTAYRNCFWRADACRWSAHSRG
ncbi:hypothetical protein ABIB75_007367 [Bradyrhizobium sp. GM2.2]